MTPMRSALLLLAFTGVLRADDAIEAREEFFTKLRQTYNYLPADVTREVRKTKLEEMKAFFAFFEKDPKTYLPFLREALIEKGANPWFCFDGATLLYSHSKSVADRKRIVAAIARCRLKDVASRAYYSFTHLLSRSVETDTFPIIAKMLEDPNFGYYLTMHAMRLGQQDSVALCLLSQDEANWVKPLVARLAPQKDGTEKDKTAMRTIIYCLMLAVDPIADQALATLIANEKAPQYARKFAQEMTDSQLVRGDLPKRKIKATRENVLAMLKKCAETGRLTYDDEGDSLMRDSFYLVAKNDAELIRRARRRLAWRTSDESLMESGYLTALLRCTLTAGK